MTRCSAAVAAQNEFKARNAELPENRRMEFRIGVNLGDVIEEESRIYGDGVNIAARLEALADPGGICISKTAFDQIETKLPLGYQFLGEQTVKNIAKPVGAYKVLMEPRMIAAEREEKKVRDWWSQRGSHRCSCSSCRNHWRGDFGTSIGVHRYVEPASKEKMAYRCRTNLLLPS